MKRYMVFIYYTYDSMDGMNDYWGSVDTVEEAAHILHTANIMKGNNGQYVDTVTGYMTNRSGIGVKIAL